MSFNPFIRRIGFACRYAEINKKGEIATVKNYQTGSITKTWALKQSEKSTVEQKLLTITKRNIQNTHHLITKISQLSPSLRMLRISSDILSFYSMPEFQSFWRSTEIQKMLEDLFAPLGETARKNDVRLSFHPDHFLVLASDREQVVDSSIDEFEYHVDMAKWMGYGKQFQDFKINVHISGKKGPNGIKQVLGRLSPQARKMITIQNQEISWGLDSTLELYRDVALVLDIHHHWVKTGEYISPQDDRIQRIIESWRGVRPVIHYSVSREDLLQKIISEDQKPQLQDLIGKGFNKQKLRAHSDYFWNSAVNKWAISHHHWADIMCESKAKNLASFPLYQNYVRL